MSTLPKVCKSLLIVLFLIGLSQTARGQSQTQAQPVPRAIDYQINSQGVEVVEQNTDGKSSVVRLVPLPLPPRALLRAGDYLYVARGSVGITLLRISDPKNPVEASTFETPEPIVGLALQNRYLLARSVEGKSFLYGLKPPYEPLIGYAKEATLLPLPPPGTKEGTALMISGGAVLGVGAVLLGGGILSLYTIHGDGDVVIQVPLLVSGALHLLVGIPLLGTGLYKRYRRIQTIL